MRKYFDGAGLILFLLGAGFTLTGLLSPWIGFACFYVVLGILVFDASQSSAGRKLPPLGRWIIGSVILVTVPLLSWNQISEYAAKKAKESSSHPATSPVSPPPVLSEIEKSLQEIERNTSQHPTKPGNPALSVAQMGAIKEIDRLILSRDETALRQAFGFPSMMETNIRMNMAIVSHFKKAETVPLDLTQYFNGKEWMVDSLLAEGHIRRFGGGFQFDPPDDKRVYLLVLPNEYTVGKKVLLKFEKSSELPTPVIKTIKDLDDAVYKNADKLLHVLNSALKKDPDYYLRYEDQSSPYYFHQVDAMWLDNFIQLRPEADKIGDAIRQFLGV